MSTQAERYADRAVVDAEHLRLLVIFHFVSAGLALCGVLFVIAHFALFYTIMSNPEVWAGQTQGPPPEMMMTIFRWFYLFFGLWFGVSGVANLMSAVYLRARRHRTFSMIVSALNCLHVPLGTLLGVFTLVVLVRESVVRMYVAAGAEATGQP
jgi:hypothetical protein